MKTIKLVHKAPRLLDTALVTGCLIVVAPPAAGRCAASDMHR